MPTKLGVLPALGGMCTALPSLSHFLKPSESNRCWVLHHSSPTGPSLTHWSCPSLLAFIWTALHFAEQERGWHERWQRWRWWGKGFKKGSQSIEWQDRGPEEQKSNREKGKPIELSLASLFYKPSGIQEEGERKMGNWL